MTDAKSAVQVEDDASTYYDTLSANEKLFLACFMRTHTRQTLLLKGVPSEFLIPLALNSDIKAVELLREVPGDYKDRAAKADAMTDAFFGRDVDFFDAYVEALDTIEAAFEEVLMETTSALDVLKNLQLPEVAAFTTWQALCSYRYPMPDSKKGA
ncbi:Hypothetical protein POVN_LOCUS122 [uncultured virus]|nr:Hypothetical protein POVN_LOCUS122 [uncultured virus]